MAPTEIEILRFSAFPRLRGQHVGMLVSRSFRHIPNGVLHHTLAAPSESPSVARPPTSRFGVRRCFTLATKPPPTRKATEQMDDDDMDDSPAAPAEYAIGDRVRIRPGTEDEVGGVVVEDFGDHAGYSVDIGDEHIVDAGRRWAITTDAGTLEFHDSSDLAAES